PVKNARRSKDAKMRTFDLYFLMRIRAEGDSKPVTVGGSGSYSNNMLLPLFPPKDSGYPFQKLIHRDFEPAETIPVQYSGDLPTDPEVRAAASSYVKAQLDGFDILDNAAGIPSKWNPNTQRWETPSKADI